MDFGGNRRVNSILCIACITQQRFTPDASIYFERKLAEGKTRRSARRMWNDETQRRELHAHQAA